MSCRFGCGTGGVERRGALAFSCFSSHVSSCASLSRRGSAPSPARSVDKEHGGFMTCLDADGTVYDTKKYVWLQVCVRAATAVALLGAAVAACPCRDALA